MRRSVSSSCFRGLLRRGSVLLAAGLMSAALPAWAGVPRCDAATCPPLQLQLEQGFEVSRQRLEQGLPAAAPAPVRPQPASQPLPEPAATESLSPWLIGALALAAGMLLQGLVQTLLRRRRTAAAVAVETAVAEAPNPVRALGLEADVAEVTPAVMLITEPPIAEAQPGPVEEEPQATPARFELEPLDIETPEPAAAVAEAQPADLAGEALPEPEIMELAPAALAEPDALERPDPASPSLVEEPQAAPVCFELEPLDAETPAPPAETAEPQIAATPDGETLPEAEVAEVMPVALAEPASLELTGEAWVTAEDPMGLALEPQVLAAIREELPSSAEPVLFELEPLDAEKPAPAAGVVDTVPGEVQPELEIVELESVPLPEADVPEPLAFALEPQFRAVGSDAMPPSEALADALDDVIAAVAQEITALDFPEDAAPAEAVADPVGLPEPSPAAAADTHRLETVALLRRLSAQRARGLHPEERLASVFRRISSGRTDAADRSLRELEAFCSEGDEAFPPELMTTRQHIVRGRGHELGLRIDALRTRAQDEASGRRLAVADAFLRRSRFDAVTDVLDELEADLGREIEIL